MSVLERRRRSFLIGLLLAVLAALGAGTAFGIIGDTPTKRTGSHALTPSEFAPQPIARRRRKRGNAARTRPVLHEQADRRYHATRRRAGRRAPRQGCKGCEGPRAPDEPAAATPATFNSAWSTIGPEPIYQPTRDSGNLIPVSGRIGAEVIRQDGTRILGAAQGGIWIWDTGLGG